MQKVFVQSSHASLEYDNARLMVELGYQVFGEWDIGSKQRPKIPGVTDVNSNIDDFDLIILHQVPKYVDVMKRLVEKGKKVALISFGQADTWQYEAISHLVRDKPNAWVVPYSVKDHRRHKEAGAPDHKNRLIYFAKWFEDFEPWVGKDHNLYATCNSWHKRGHGCSWEIAKHLIKKVPTKFSGKETNEVGGLGEIEQAEMHKRFRDSAGFVSFGTAPAALVLSLIEAWCAGCPTVCYDNGHGLAEEGMKMPLEKSLTNLTTHARRLITDKAFRERLHRVSLQNRERFDAKKIGPQWKALIDEMIATQ